MADLGGAALVAGDFNTPCEGSIYRTYWSSFCDAFTTAGTGLGHTYFADGAAVRIDHIMMGSRLAMPPLPGGAGHRFAASAGDCGIGEVVPPNPVAARYFTTEVSKSQSSLLRSARTKCIFATDENGWTQIRH